LTRRSKHRVGWRRETKKRGRAARKGWERAVCSVQRLLMLGKEMREHLCQERKDGAAGVRSRMLEVHAAAEHGLVTPFKDHEKG
jgi:hypothetical protein